MKRSKKWWRRSKYGIAALALTLCCYQFHEPCAASLRSAFSYLVYPFLRLQHFVVAPLTAWQQQRATEQQLRERLVEQTERAQALQEYVTQLQASRDFAEDTAEIVAFKKRYQTDNAVLGQIIHTTFDEQHNELTLDVGSAHGVSEDMVAVYKNNLVGRVSAVYPRWCKVTLITDTTCKVGAYCAHTKAAGIHEGTNDVATRLSFVSHLETVREGDLILSSGQGMVFPRGFAVGRVKEARLNGLQYTVTVDSILDFQSLRYCYLLAK